MKEPDNSLEEVNRRGCVLQEVFLPTHRIAIRVVSRAPSVQLPDFIAGNLPP